MGSDDAPTIPLDDVQKFVANLGSDEKKWASVPYATQKA